MKPTGLDFQKSETLSQFWNFSPCLFETFPIHHDRREIIQKLIWNNLHISPTWQGQLNLVSVASALYLFALNVGFTVLFMGSVLPFPG